MCICLVDHSVDLAAGSSRKCFGKMYTVSSTEQYSLVATCERFMYVMFKANAIVCDAQMLSSICLCVCVSCLQAQTVSLSQLRMPLRRLASVHCMQWFPCSFLCMLRGCFCALSHSQPTVAWTNGKQTNIHRDNLHKISVSSATRIWHCYTAQTVAIDSRMKTTKNRYICHSPQNPLTFILSSSARNKLIYHTCGFALRSDDGVRFHVSRRRRRLLRRRRSFFDKFAPKKNLVCARILRRMPNEQQQNRRTKG